MTPLLRLLKLHRTFLGLSALPLSVCLVPLACGGLLWARGNGRTHHELVFIPTPYCAGIHIILQRLMEGLRGVVHGAVKRQPLCLAGVR